MQTTARPDERRRDIRVTFRTSITLSFPDGRTFDNCETMDISVSGFFVKGVTDVDIAEKCHVTFNLSGRTSNLVLEMFGEIIRVQEDGVAMQFVEVDEDSFFHLQNIVYFSYKHSGGVGAVLAEIDDVEDESLYCDLEVKGKSVPFPKDYPADFDDEDLDDSDDTVDKIADELKKQDDDPDF